MKKQLKPEDMDWSKYENFTKEEFDCKHTGKNEMTTKFMDRLQELRTLYGKPMIITSGYRDKTHPVEVNKTRAGAHSSGEAADIAVDREDAYNVLKLAMQLEGFTGIGVKQKDGGRFLHLDTIDKGTPDFLRPTVWSY